MSLTGGLILWALILGPYIYPGYMMMSRQCEQTPARERCAAAFFIYIMGIILMLGSDLQKYLTLRARKGLINDGFFRYTRNPNYLGEIMIYSSFAIIVDEYLPWGIFINAWIILFLLRMCFKDWSLSRKLGWKKYKESSWMLLPKIYDSDFVSLMTYFGVGMFFTTLYTFGGIENISNTVRRQYF